MTRGNFYYDFDHNGWVLKEEIRNRPDLPILILVGADDYYIDWVDGMVNSVINGSADAYTRSFLSVNGTASTPQDAWYTRPEEFRNGGAVIVLDFQYYNRTEGAATFENGLRGNTVTGVAGIDTSIKLGDNWWGSQTVDGATTHQQFSERWYVNNAGRLVSGRPTADLVIRVNGLLAHDITVSGGSATQNATQRIAEYRKILNPGVVIPPASADGHVYFKLTDFNNSYFEKYGFTNLSDYLSYIREHEFMHSARNEALTPQGGFAQGHGGIWTNIFATNLVTATASSITVSRIALLGDTVELGTLTNRIANGRFYLPAGGTKATQAEFNAIPAEILLLFPADRRNRDSINVKSLMGFLDYRQRGLQGIVGGAIAQWKAEWVQAHPGQTAPEPTLDQLATGGFLTSSRGSTNLTATESEAYRIDLLDLADMAFDGLLNSFIDIDGGQIGLALGSVLGKRLTSNPFGQIVASGTLSTVLGAVGEFIDKNLGGTPSTHILGAGLEGFGVAILENIKGAGIGALSSFLTAELVDALGLDGIPGEIANNIGGAVVTQILNNIPRIGDAIRNTTTGEIIGYRGLFTDIGPTLIASAAASYLGGKLGDAIYTPKNVGGQIGAAVGSIYGGWAASVILASGLNPFTFAAAVVAVALWQVIGGLVGSLFGGTPRSGADAAWDQAQSEFVVANVYARKGGTKEAAKALAGAVADNFNAVLAASGSTLLDPGSVQSGNYGMRMTTYVYRPVATTDKDAITARFTGENGAVKLITHGTYLGLSSMVGQMAGGDVYVKRAISASLVNAHGNPNSNAAGAAGNFDIEILLGDVSIASDYALYVKNSMAINGLIAADPQSAFAAGWLVTLARANELGLHRRGTTDWIGGYDVFLDEALDGGIGGEALNAAQLKMGIDPTTGARYWSVTDVAGEFVGFIEDTIESRSDTAIGGTSVDDRIVFAGDHLLASSVLGYPEPVNQDLTVNGTAHNGGALVIDVAATIDAGAGDDFVQASDRGDNVFGADGNDTLYGGRLDDWLLGGNGNDELRAGDEAGNFGGDGNYLAGGAGTDTLHGGEGSDWLEGGDGDDVIEGGGGEDILAGGAGHDVLHGGQGGDTYIVRLGDESDEAEEVATAAVVGAVTVLDPVKARFAGIAAGTIKRNWGGDAFDLAEARLLNEAAETAAETAAANGNGILAAPVAVAAVTAAGEDSIVFGIGIEAGDMRLSRLGGAEGPDLLIQVMRIDAAGTGQEPSGTELVVKDWFANPFKRVEWLKFADGTEIRIGDITSFVVGTAGADVLIGTAGNDFVVAGSGDDQLHLLAGDDVGNGGAGNDLVAGDDGADLLIGGLGDDKLIGGGGRDAMTGDSGADDVYGGAGDDILSGGRGDDLMAGGQGNDRFKYMRGDGRDTVFDEFSNNWAVVWTAAGGGSYGAGYTRNPTTGEVAGPDGALVYKNMGTADAPDFKWLGRFDYNFATGTLYRYDDSVAVAASVVNAGLDTIEFGIGIDIQDIILTRATGSFDLVLTVSQEDEELPSYLSSTDSITLKNWYYVPGQIEKIAFYQTGILAIGPGGTNLVAGTDAANGTTGTPLAGMSGADWITGGAGDDVVAGGAGDDIVSGNSGFDTLKGEAGSDVLYGGGGNDTLDGGGETMAGLIATDLLFGGAGSDTATYASSNAIVRAYLGASWANSGAAQGDQYFSVENLIGGTFGVSIPTPGTADVLGGDEGDNEITGGRGDDTMMGGAGNDTYMWNGAEWSDTIREGAFQVEQAANLLGKLDSGYKIKWSQGDALAGGSGYYRRLEVINAQGETAYDWAKFVFPAGSEPAITAGFVDPTAAQADTTGWDTRGWNAALGFSRTNGWQVTREKFDTAADGGEDAIELGTGLSLTDYIFLRVGDDGLASETGSHLMIRYQGSGVDYMLIKNQYTSWGAVELLQFRDGLSVSLANLKVAEAGATLAGTGADEFLSALSGTTAEHLLGLGGNDVLSGLKGNDWLEGGEGDDVLEGGAGSDTLNGGTESLPGVKGWGDTIRYVHSLTAVNVDLRKTTAQLGGDAIGDILIDIENVVGSATAGDTIHGDDQGNRIDGLDGANTLHGWGGDDVVTAGTGADFLYGEDGDDAIAGADGNDSLFGGLGADRLTGGAGADKLWGDDGNDVLLGGEGDDTILDGGSGNDEILGQEGNDVVTGGAGADLIVGGAGNDAMSGGGDNDNYLFERGSGTDTITDTAGVNTIQFADGIEADKLWLAEIGPDLLISVIGTTDSVKVMGFFSGGGRIHSLQTASRTIFLDHASTATLIAAMKAVTGIPVVPGTTTPMAMPASIAALLATYWHAGDKAAPTVSATPQVLAGTEDVPIAFTGSWGVVDHDGNLTGYSVIGTPSHGTVTLTDAASGSLVYTPDSNFNGEDNFILLATDADGQTVQIPVTVAIAAVADAPTNLREEGNVPLAVGELSAGGTTENGTPVGRVVGLDPDGDGFTWSFAHDGPELLDADGRFGITADGQIFVADATRLDREVDTSHVVRVRATDVGGASAERDFIITVADVNEPNSIAPLPAVATGEDAAVGSLIATAHASDADQSGAFSQQRYVFLDGDQENQISGDGRLTIDSVTGEIRILAALDHESGAAQRSYTVAARDNPGGNQSFRAQTTLVLTVTDVNEANVFDMPAPMAINEGADTNALVGIVHARDGDTSGAFAEQRYYFGDGAQPSAISSDGRYRIDEISGEIRTNAVLNFEGLPPPATYRVLAIDNPGGTARNVAETSVHISITDINEPNHLAPTTPLLPVTENGSLGLVGTITATDDDSGGINATQAYSFLVDDAPVQVSADGRFAIDIATGAITSRVALDHEATPTLSYAVVARDRGGAASSFAAVTQVVITVADANDPNNFAGPLSFFLDENAGSLAVGAALAGDGDAAGTLNAQQLYAFRHADGSEQATTADGRFTIGAATGIITAVGSIDFEDVTAPLSYTVAARDRGGAAGGNVTTTGVTIVLRNLNEAPATPIALGSPAAVVGEGAAWTATYQLSDPDGTTPRLHFVANPGGRFKIVGNSITFEGDVAPSFETLYAAALAAGGSAIDSDGDQLWEIQLAGSADATDDLLFSAGSVAFSVKVEDVNEAPSSLSVTMVNASVEERDRMAASETRPAIAIATLAVVDPDSPDFSTGRYTYASSDDRFQIDGATLYLKSGKDLDYEALVGGAFSLVVRATDQTGGPGALYIERTISITVTNRDDVAEGDAGANSIIGQQNRDLIYGFAGNDTIDGAAGNDRLDGGTGDDHVAGGDGVDELIGDLGVDILVGGAGVDSLDGGGDDDVLYGGAGNDVLTGGSGADAILGGEGADRLVGGSGSDWAIYSQLDENVAATAGIVADLLDPSRNTGVAAGDTYDGIENLSGSNLADTLRGDANSNLLYGMMGDDVLEGGGEADEIHGGDGGDIIYGDFSDDPLAGTASPHSGHGADLLYGDAGDDVIYGGLGGDTIDGGIGNDIIYAQGDDDLLIGDVGDDTLHGGQGSDTYVMDRASGKDTIFNFNPNGLDKDILGIRNTAGAVEDRDLWFEQINGTTKLADPNGTDLRISILGSTASMIVKNWFPPETGRVYRIDFITTQNRFTKEIDVDGLVALMRGRTSLPASTDVAYWDQWQAFWFTNFKPVITGDTAATVTEDAPATFNLTVTDDITPANGITVGWEYVSGTQGLVGSVVKGAPDAQGHRTFQITPTAHMSGSTVLKLTAYDAGNHPSDPHYITVNVTGLPNKPTVSQFSATPGTSGLPAGLAVQLQVSFPDDDGSEAHEIRITGLPASLAFSAGERNAAGYWKLSRAQLAGLKLIAPSGWSQDVTLTARAYATESGLEAVSDAVSTTVSINAPPTGATINNSASASIAENSASLTVGTVIGQDADGDTLKYFLVDVNGVLDTSGPFTITQGGILSARSASILNFENGASYSVRVRVEDASTSIVVPLTINILNVNEQNSIAPTYPNMAILENVVAASSAGSVTATDYDLAPSVFAQQRYYFLVAGVGQADSGDGRFTISETTGEIRSKMVFNTENWTGGSYAVIARDNAGVPPYNQVATQVTITITDVNEPNSLFGKTLTVHENLNGVNSVGFAGATDADRPTVDFGKQKYGFETSPGVVETTSADGRFTIDPWSGEIKTTRAYNKEGETGGIYKVVARDNLGAGSYFEAKADFVILIGDVNEANSFAGAYNGAIDENATPGAATRIKVFGTSIDLQVAAGDLDGPLTTFGKQRYYFSDGNGGVRSTSLDGRFTMDETTGYISLALAISFETVGPTLTYNVVARDLDGGAGAFQATTGITIQIRNLNEPNVIPERYDFTVDENVGLGSFVGLVAASDPDAPTDVYGMQRYFFKYADGTTGSQSADGRFSINAATGTITTTGSPNFETIGAAPTKYVIVAQDNAGAAGFNHDTTDVYISVNDRPENPFAPSGPASAFFDEAGIGLDPAEAPRIFASYGLSDPDLTLPQLQFAAGGNLGGWFAIAGNQVIFAANFDYETAVAGGHVPGDGNGDGVADVFIGNVVVQAWDGALASMTTTSTAFYLSNTRERPNALTLQSWNAYSETLPGDVSHAHQVVARFGLSDPDGPTPTLMIVGGNGLGWFTTSGNALTFADVNLTSTLCRASLGQPGVDSGWNYDLDQDGLMEIKIATLTLKAVDANGLESDPFSYSIYLEDKNEAPAFTAGSYALSLSENAGAYQVVGAVQASDVDGPAGELRYLFAGAVQYWNAALGRQVSASSDGKFVMDVLDGRILVNAGQAINYEAAHSLAYQVQVYDRSAGAYSLSATAGVTIDLQDVNEPHSLQAAQFTINESSVPLGPFVSLPATSGAVIDLKASMLLDPEGHNMHWQFANGSTTWGGWQIEQDGTLRMMAGVDYDTMIHTWVYDVITGYDRDGEPIYNDVRGPNDLSQAVISLDIQAVDTSTGLVKDGVLTLTVADVNEDVTAWAYPNFVEHDGGKVLKIGYTEFYVKGEVKEGKMFQIYPSDPEERALTFTLTEITRRDINSSSTGNTEIDSGYPTLSIDNAGIVAFNLPPGVTGNDDSWQGGVHTSAGRRKLSIEYTFSVNMTDTLGMTTSITYIVTFLRRDSSVPPIVFDLDGDGLELVAFDGSTIDFDMDEDGIRDRTGWVGADDGLLALDRNGDGIINDISEISFVGDGVGAISDLEGLRSYDTNADGFLDSGDVRFGEFRIWRDSNQDGISQETELLTLSEAGIVSVNLTLNRTGEDPGGADNVIYATSEYLAADGTRRLIGDVFLAFEGSRVENIAAPIVVDYDGDGSGLVSLASSSALFDMDGDGDLDRTGWISAGDALLVLDRDGNGQINGISEISFKGDRAGARTDLEGLAAFDTDGDGFLRSHDSRFGDFKLWFDNDGNGATGAGELLTLAEAGILEISLSGTPTVGAAEQAGANIVYATGSFKRIDGTAGSLLDAGFAYADAGIGANRPDAPADTSPAEPVPGPAPAADALAHTTLDFTRKSDRYRLNAQGGILSIGETKAKGALDPRAGSLGVAASLSFRGRDYGILTPLVLDLDGDGIELKGRGKSRARFDMDGDGSADDTGWIGRSDGFLVHDANSDGLASSAAELSLLSIKKDAKSSFEALALLDSNRNGQIDSGDVRFGELKVWRDSNGNGISEAGELSGLKDLGISSIGLGVQALNGTVKLDRNLVFATSTFTRTDGSTGTIGDAALSFRPGGAGAPAPARPGDGLPAQLPEWLNALRRGQEGLEARQDNLRRILDRRLDQDPFASFDKAAAAAVQSATAAEVKLHTQDLPREPLSAASGEGGSGLDVDLRLPHMIQQMAAFGVRSGEGEWRQQANAVNPRFEFFS